MKQPDLPPLDFVRQHDCGSHFVLLHSGMLSQGSGGQSFLATHPARTLEGDRFAPLEHALTTNNGRWFGYLGYELKHDLEQLSPTPPSIIDLAPMWMMQPQQQHTWQHADHTPPPLAPLSCSVDSLHSNQTKADYLRLIEQTLEQIHAGAFYQANITRKFYGTFDQTPDPFALFCRLQSLSPSPFAAYIQMGDCAILSSSPEGFLSVNASGHITTRPIKGSAPRGATPTEDAAIIDQLRHSTKDRAENLMIVDLMRNDLSRASRAGSVNVTGLHHIHSYATIHQMVSTIQSQRRDDCSTLDAIRACFPPGSMTGAPKIRAMQWCAQLEAINRGVYSGALGWMDSDGQCDLSVVIRTLMIQGNRFEFQVGGGIVADSTPETEWQETLVKASAIAQTIGIPMSALEAL